MTKAQLRKFRSIANAIIYDGPNELFPRAYKNVLECFSRNFGVSVCQNRYAPDERLESWTVYLPSIYALEMYDDCQAVLRYASCSIEDENIEDFEVEEAMKLIEIKHILINDNMISSLASGTSNLCSQLVQEKGSTDWINAAELVKRKRNVNQVGQVEGRTISEPCIGRLVAAGNIQLEWSWDRGKVPSAGIRILVELRERFAEVNQLSSAVCHYLEGYQWHKLGKQDLLSLDEISNGTFLWNIE